MQTGWEHDDHQTRREFERLRQKEAAAKDAPLPDGGIIVRGGLPGVSDNQDPSIVSLRSPYDTIDIRKQGQTFDIDRFLTLRLNDEDVIVREGSSVAKTVKYINFLDGGNIAWTLTRGEDDEVLVEAVATGAGFYTFDVSDSDETTTIGAAENIQFLGLNSLNVELTPGAPNVFEFSRSVQIKDDGVAVGTGATTDINFDSNGQTATDIEVNFVVDLISATEVRVRGYVPTAAGGMTSWDVIVNGGVALTITDGDQLEFLEGLNVNLSRTGNQITIATDPYPDYTWDVSVNSGAAHTVTDGSLLDFLEGLNVNISRAGNAITIATDAYPDYSWNLLDADETTEIGDGEDVRFVGLNGVLVELTPGSPNLIEISRALTFYQTHDTDVNDFTSTSAIVGVTYENATLAKPAGYTSRVWTEVTEPVAGQIKIEHWYEDTSGGDGYSWFLEDADESSEIEDTHIVRFTGSKRVTVELTPGTPNIVDISRPLQMYVDGVAVGDDTTYEIDLDSDGQTSTDVAVNFVAVDIGGGRIRYRGYVPSGGDGYTWVLKAPTSADTGEVIGSGQDAIFQGTGFNTTSRVGDTVYIHGAGEYTDPQTGKRVKTGFLEWDSTGTPPTGEYGIVKSDDIDHNWGLINMHMWELELRDVSFATDGTTLKYMRSGATTMAGESPDNFAFRMIPYKQAVDGNKIRVWITQSQIFGTDGAKMFYVLREA